MAAVARADRRSNRKFWSMGELKRERAVVDQLETKANKATTQLIKHAFAKDAHDNLFAGARSGKGKRTWRLLRRLEAEKLAVQKEDLFLRMRQAREDAAVARIAWCERRQDFGALCRVLSGADNEESDKTAGSFDFRRNPVVVVAACEALGRLFFEKRFDRDALPLIEVRKVVGELVEAVRIAADTPDDMHNAGDPEEIAARAQLRKENRRGTGRTPDEEDELLAALGPRDVVIAACDAIAVPVLSLRAVKRCPS